MSPEEILLLKLAVPRLDAKDLSLFVQSPSVNWDRLFHLAQRHGMAGVVASPLLVASDGFMPEKIRKEWTALWRSLALRDLAQLAALQEILAAAQSQGMSPLLLKGLAVHLQVYPKNAARGASDVDLLIRLEEVPRFVRCLETLGFVPLFSDGSTLFKRTNEADFHRSRDGVSVDLHWAVCAPAEEFATGLRLSESLWESQREILLGGFACQVPGREEELLFLCVQLLKSSPFLLRNLSDLLRLVHASASVDWGRLLSLASSTGTETMAYYAFELVSEVDPAPIPPFVRARLARSGKSRWLFAPFLRLDRLLKTQGNEGTNLALRWRGVFFARRGWIWAPYQATLYGKRILRKIRAVLR